MKQLLLIIMLLIAPSAVFAQEYTANVWASWATITANAQVTMNFPYKSRTITIINGGSVPVCASFSSGSASNTLNSSCFSTGNNRTFQIGNGMFLTLNNLVQSSVNFSSISATTASPVTVIVDY